MIFSSDISIISSPKLLVNRVVQSCKKRLFLGGKWGVDPIFCLFLEILKIRVRKKSACRKQTEAWKIKNAHLCSVLDRGMS